MREAAADSAVASHGMSLSQQPSVEAVEAAADAARQCISSCQCLRQSYRLCATCGRAVAAPRLSRSRNLSSARPRLPAPRRLLPRYQVAVRKEADVATALRCSCTATSAQPPSEVRERGHQVRGAMLYAKLSRAEPTLHWWRPSQAARQCSWHSSARLGASAAPICIGSSLPESSSRRRCSTGMYRPA